MKEIDYKERTAKLLAEIDITQQVMLARINKLLTILTKLELRKAGVDDKDIEDLLKE